MNNQNSRPTRFRRKPLITALEPRILLDGAVVATTAEMTTDVAFQEEAVHSESAEQSVHFAAPAPTGNEGGARREVAFVDTSIEDHQTLVEGLESGVEVFLIDGGQNGLEQVRDALQGLSGIDAIHVYSHGDVGQLQLGSLTLDESNLTENAALLEAIGQSLTSDGDLMLYGCSVGADNAGQSFIDRVAQLTSADVAASSDLTGAQAQGGDWELEASSGVIETQSMAVAGYGHTLSVSGWNDQSYTEQQGEISLGNGITLSNGQNYGTGYIQFEVTDNKQAEDFLRLASSNDPMGKDQISIQGNNVYMGMGAGQPLLKIGSIDSYLNGQDGRALRINFDNATIPGSSPVVNGDFSQSFDAGWNAYTGHIDLGVTSITFSNGKTWVIPEPGSQYYPSQTPGRDDNDRASGSYGSYDNPIVQIDNGRLRLEESRMTTSPYGVVHGPAAYSDVFRAEAGMVLKFDWQANNINDDYHVVAYLMNADTGVAQLVFADWGTRGSNTEFVTVSTTGNYSFVFVSGTFDRTGGTLAGASMYIDNIRVEKAAVTDQVISNLAMQVLYKNTSDNPSTSKTVTLSTRNISGQTQSDTMNLSITPVNDPSSLGGNAQLPTILEDQAVNQGRTVGQLFGGVFADVDNGDVLGGVFITSNPLAGDTSKGTWEYQVAGSSTWQDVGGVSQNNALLLAADTRIRFNPASDWHGTPQALELKGVDQTLAGLTAATTEANRAFFDTTAATPQSGLSDATRTLSINVTSVNDIPVFENSAFSGALGETAGPDGTLGAVLTGKLQVSDIETDASLLALAIRGGVETSSGVWQLSGRYGTLVLDTNNENTWTYTPDKWDAINALREGQSVTDTFQFKVSDPDGGVAQQAFTITLNGVNDTPLVAQALPDQAFTGAGDWVWQVPAGTFTDAEGTGMTYTAWVTQVGGVAVTPYAITAVKTTDGSAADWLTFDADSRTFRGDPNPAWADKALTIEIRADDGAAHATSAFTLTLANTADNQAPTVAAELNWASLDAAGTGWTYQIPGGTFVDDDSPVGLSYSAFVIDPTSGTRTAINGTQAPGLVFDAANGMLSGDGTARNLLIEVIVTDDKESGYSQQDVSTQFQLIIYDSNDTTPAVSATAGAAGVGLLIDGEGSGRYTLPAGAFDIQGPAGSTVAYAAQLAGGGNLPDWLSFDTTTGTFTGNPPHGASHLSIHVTATVTDGTNTAASAPLSLTLQIANPNDALALGTAPLADQVISAGGELGLTFAAPFTDPDATLSGTETNAGVPRVDGVDYHAFVVAADGTEKPVTDFGLVLAVDGDGKLTLNGNPPGGHAYLNILLRGTEVEGGTTRATTFTVFLNDVSASDGQDVAAYSANEAGKVTVDGLPTQGQTLEASTADENGLSGVARYQWQVSSDNGTTWQDIARPAAQTASLQLTQAEAGKQVRVQSFYTDDSGVFENPVSDALSVADVDDAGAISVAGSQTVGGVLSSTLSDPDGLTKADPTYQWEVSTDGGTTWVNIAGATYSTYQITSNEGGHQVRVKATYVDDMNNSQTVTSASKAIQLGAVAPEAGDDAASVTEAGGIANASPAATPVSGNVLTNDTDRNAGDTLTIANLRTGNTEGFGINATGTDAFVLAGQYGQILMQKDGSYIYTVDEQNANVQALAPGQQLTEYFNYSVKDSTELFDIGLLAITINGSNDAPEVSVSPVDDIEEAIDASAQNLQVQGTLSLDDVDKGDLLDLTFSNNANMSWSGGNLSSELEALLWSGFRFNETTDNRTAPDTITWAYEVSNANLDFLATGETITFSYTIKVTDTGGLEAVDTLTFTINGSNDTPVVQVSTATDFVEAVNAKAQSLVQSGTVSFSDADRNNVLIDIAYSSNNDIAWVRRDGSPVDNLPGDLAARLVGAFHTGAQDAANNGQIAWAFDASTLDLDFLNAGDKVTFSYTVTATDEQGAHHSQQLAFTLIGTNDAPEVTSVQLSREQTIVQMGQQYRLDISLLFSDKDSVSSREDLDFRIEGLPVGLTYNAETGVISGAAQKSGIFQITMTAIDAEGATVQRTFELTVTAVTPDAGRVVGAGDVPLPPPETAPQPLSNALSGLPSGLVGSGSSSDPVDNTGFIGSNANNGINGVAETGASNERTDVGGATNNSAVQLATGSERVVLSEAGVIVTQARSVDGNVILRASVDVNVGSSGEVVFSDAQKDAFGVVSLSVANIARTSASELVVDIEDSSPNSSSQFYSGTLGNGSSLPSWVTLDPATGTVTINNPPAGQREVIIRIQAIGADGQVRILELKLDLEKLLKMELADDEASAGLDDRVFISLSEQLAVELDSHAHYGSRLVSSLQSA